MHTILLLLVLVIGWVYPAVPARAEEALPETVVFNRDIRPILSDACFHCHGPDRGRRKGDLRLDTAEQVYADRGGHRLLVPGKPQESELLRRLVSEEANERMPPAISGRKLTARQIALVRRWIEQGAKWQGHWAFVPPERPTVPVVSGPVRNPIDAFVLERLKKEGLGFSPEAEKAILLRRVTLDLTGLPPTPEEVAAFEADSSPDAYERVVERLFASPRYGERMALRWLEAARYADTHGYQTDGERVMWRWRDWVIDAYNRNLPFDRFTTEQIAGDLLPGATLEQRIATGFNRNHRGNSEGGIIPEEYAVEYVCDRVETTATVWLGLTLGCSRCHDHKYDPLMQKDFYRLYAYFNSIPEQGRAVKYGNSPPVLKSPTPEQQDQLAELDVRIARAEKEWERLQPKVRADQTVWEQRIAVEDRVEWLPEEGFLQRFALAGQSEFDGTRGVDGGNAGDFGFYDRFTVSLWVRPEGTKGGLLVGRTAPTARGDGWSLTLEPGNKVGVHLVKRWLDDAIHVETEQPLVTGKWQHVTLRYDGSRVASGIRVDVNGRPAKVKVVLDELNQSFQNKETLRIGGGAGEESRFRGGLREVVLYRTDLADEWVQVLPVGERVDEIARMPVTKRSPEQQSKLAIYFREKRASEVARAALQELRRLRSERAILWDSVPTTMVMEELNVPRPAHILRRGQYDQPGEKVERGVPAVLPGIPSDAPQNRLGLARWLIAPGNPLTARVAVNRLWQQHFGQGLVKTPDDFGSQGDWPSHPELLDWLATEFVRTGWDVRAMQRLIVQSHAYRQASRTTPMLLAKDPYNRLLARGPRFRLSAEMIRDQALAVSGLLVERVGGPSVKPYQPAGLWKDLTGSDEYVQDHGANLYRRGLYTFWKRTAAPPLLTTFDAAGREVCIVRESRTNTPLQALNLMNDVTFVEAARVLAQRVLEAGPESDADLVERLFRRVLGRGPGERERSILTAALQKYRDRFGRDPQAARKLVAVGEAPRVKSLDEREWAAMTLLASLVFNLDEAVTRE